MKKSTAYTITKMIQSFLATALEIKTKYIDTGSYSKTKELLDFGTDEKPSVWALAFRMTDMCRENDASYHMGTPILDEDTLSAYADHIIDNGDIIASGKITKEKISVLEDVIEFFQAEYPKLYDDCTDNVPEITTVCNTLKYIKEWESEYCQNIDEEISREHDAANEVTEDEYTKRRLSVPVTKVEYERIMGDLHKFAYEMEKITSLNYDQSIIFEKATAAGVDFSNVNLYDEKQTSSFYKTVYNYSKKSDGRRFLSLFDTPYEGFPIKKDKRKVYEDWKEPTDVLLFYFEAFICKWPTLHIDLLRLYDYAIANDDVDILKDMNELLEEAQPFHLCFRYNRDSKHRGHYDEGIYSVLSKFAQGFGNVKSKIDRHLYRTEEGLVGDDEISSRKWLGSIIEFDTGPSAEGNKGCWTDKTVERFMKLSIDDFVFVLRGDFDTFKRYGLKKFESPSLSDIYDYVELHSGGFKRDKMSLLLSQLESANTNQYAELLAHAVKEQILYEEVDEETGKKTIEYMDDTPLDENGDPIPEKCYELRYGERKHDDDFRYDYAVGILYEKLGYLEDASQEPFEVDGIEIRKYIKSAPRKSKIVDTESEGPALPTTPIDKVLKKTVQYHKRVAIYDHLIENKGIRSAHNYIGAIAIAMKDHKMVDYKYQDFSALSLALGKAVGFDENRMNIRATKIGQKHKETANAFIDTVSKSREPRKQEE